MRITIERLGEISKAFLVALDKAQVTNVQELERLAGEAIPVPDTTHEYVSISWRDSMLGTKVIDASYILQHEKEKIGSGLPLCLKINRPLSYSNIIIKAQEPVENYSPFVADPFDNIIQARILETIDFQEVKNEIERLSSNDRF